MYRISKSKSDKKYQEKPENKAKHYLVQKQWRETNRDRSNEVSKLYRERRPEIGIAYRKKYNLVNRDVMNSRLAKYRAAKKAAIPEWADLKSIELLYVKCKRLGIWTGERLHIDHIVPLQSDLVCGLHCENNLRILSAKENVTKGNRHWPDMW